MRHYHIPMRWSSDYRKEEKETKTHLLVFTCYTFNSTYYIDFIYKKRKINISGIFSLVNKVLKGVNRNNKSVNKCEKGCDRRCEQEK